MKTINLKNYFELLLIEFSNEITLICDSGGTKTDWSLLSDNIGYFFSTNSYHPNTLGNTNDFLFLTWLADLCKEKEITFHFFGAGCLNPFNHEKIRKHFSSCQFKSFYIESDLYAACLATLKEEAGYVGILGTGSVLCYFDSTKITEVIGGFGYILGDEGSGFHFGKLVVNYYLSGKGSVLFNTFIEEKYGNRSTILNQVYSDLGKHFLSSIRIDSDNKSLQDEVKSIHMLNLTYFIDKHLPTEAVSKEISFIGSYAFYNQDILSDLLSVKGWKLNTVIQKPLLELSKFLIHRNKM